MDDVRLGFIGAGFMAREHTKMLQPVPGARIGPVYDIDADRATAFTSDLGGQSVASAQAVVDDCDAVVVATWTSSHLEAVELVAAAGRPLLCEKPLGVDLDQARRLADVVLDAGVINQVGLVMRRSPAFRWLRAELATRRPMNLVFRDDQYLPIQGQYQSQWRADPRRAGSGVVLEHSIHDLDLLDWLIGPITSVAAVTGERHGIAGIEDHATITVTGAGGAQAVLATVWHDILRRPSSRRVEAFTDDGMFTVEGEWFGPVTAESDAEQYTLAGAELHDRAVAIDGDAGNPDGAFVDAVRADRPASPDVRVALRAHELVDAAYRSAATGGVPVPL